MPRKIARERGGFWVGACAVVFYPLTRAVARRHLSGLDRVPPSGPALLVCNHVSYLDPVYTAVFVHRRGRVPRFLAKEALWSVPLLGRAMAGSGQIPVYRHSTEPGESLVAAHTALDQGKIVLIYPEGTVTRDPRAWPMRSQTGAARLALTHDIPVIPTVHWGTHRVYDHYRKRFRPLPRKDVTVATGPPVDLSAYRDRPLDHELLREVTDLIMSRVRDLLAEVRGQVAPDEFFEPPGRSR